VFQSLKLGEKKKSGGEKRCGGWDEKTISIYTNREFKKTKT
jgi:hypothetical protein